MSEHKIKLDTCLNDFKTLEEKHSVTSLKLVLYETESKAKENFKQESSERYCNDRILKLEIDNATCQTEKESLKEKFKRCEDDRVPCEKNINTLRTEHKNELDKCQTEARKTLVNLTECETERKVNGTCQNENKNLKEKNAKCETDRVSCGSKLESVTGDYNTVHEGFIKCDVRYQAEIDNHDKKRNEKKGNENKGNEEQSRSLVKLLEECSRDKKKCEELQKNYEKEKKTKGWF